MDSSEWSPRGVAELEPAAERAVRTTKNTLVIAGPGAGKTELLAQRACYLLETRGCPEPKRILSISFKRDAAKNLRERVALRCPGVLSRRFDSNTFDSFAKGVLDQFAQALPERLRPTLPYEIILTDFQDSDVANALSRMDPPPNLGRPTDLRRYANKDFFREHVLRTPLTRAPETLAAWAAQQFWYQQIATRPSRLTFSMITRLARLLVTVDPRVKRMLRSSYSHVLLDEFQDTTDAQLSLLRALFENSASILTAVGDRQQMVMGWAGAARKGFSEYVDAFNAEEVRLERNRRASDDIGMFVGYVARRLRGEDSNPTHSPEQVGRAVSANLFESSEDEARWMAQEIQRLLESGVKPRQIGVLVRMKAHEYGAAVIAELSARGVHARVEDSVQDLLSEPASQLHMLGLRALSTEAPGAAWASFRQCIGELNGVHPADDRSYWTLEKQLQLTRSSLLPLAKDFASHVAELIASLEPIAGHLLRSRHPQYARGTFYEKTIEQLRSVLTTSCSAGSWEGALGRAEGLDTVPVLTIHKSKGLEYDAVFFLGLEDGAFWNFRNQPDDELSAFFVALSRAKHSVAFSFARMRTRGGRTTRQSREQLDIAYALLRDAGVAINRHSAWPQ